MCIGICILGPCHSHYQQALPPSCPATAARQPMKAAESVRMLESKTTTKLTHSQTNKTTYLHIQHGLCCDKVRARASGWQRQDMQGGAWLPICRQWHFQGYPFITRTHRHSKRHIGPHTYTHTFILKLFILCLYNICI